MKIIEILLFLFTDAFLMIISQFKACFLGVLMILYF